MSWRGADGLAGRFGEKISTLHLGGKEEGYRHFAQPRNGRTSADVHIMKGGHNLPTGASAEGVYAQGSGEVMVMSGGEEWGSHGGMSDGWQLGIGIRPGDARVAHLHTLGAVVVILDN